MVGLLLILASAQLASCSAPDLTQGPEVGAQISFDLNGLSVTQDIQSVDQGAVSYVPVLEMPPGAPPPPPITYTSAAGLVVTSMQQPTGAGMEWDIDPSMVARRASDLEIGESARFTTSQSVRRPGGGAQRQNAELEVTFLGCGVETTLGGEFEVAIFEVTQTVGARRSQSEIAWSPELGWPVRDSSGSATQQYSGSGR